MWTTITIAGVSEYGKYEVREYGQIFSKIMSSNIMEITEENLSGFKLPRCSSCRSSFMQLTNKKGILKLVLASKVSTASSQ